MHTARDPISSLFQNEADEDQADSFDDWELISDIAVGPTAAPDPAPDEASTHTELAAALGANPGHGNMPTLPGGGLLQPLLGEWVSMPLAARLDYSHVSIQLDESDERRLAEALRSIPKPTLCHSAAYGASSGSGSEPRKNPRWLCETCERSNWFCNVDCIGCRRPKPLKPRRPVAWVDNKLRDPNVHVPSDCRDPGRWKQAGEALGYALSNTLRHRAKAMGLKPLVVDGVETTPKSTSCAKSR
jgi:hypothetical protein